MTSDLIPTLTSFTSDPLLRDCMLMFNCEPDADLDGEPTKLRAVPAFVPVVDVGPVVEMPKKRVEVDLFGEVVSKAKKGKRP